MKTPLHCLPPDTSDVLFYLMIWIYTCQTLYLSTRKTLMCVLCNKVSSLLRSDTLWFFTGTLIWYHTYTQTNTHTHTHTHTHKDTKHTRASRLTHPYKYIFISPAMCSQQLSLLHWMNNSLIPKIYFLQCLFFSKIIHL